MTQTEREAMDEKEAKVLMGSITIKICRRHYNTNKWNELCKQVGVSPKALAITMEATCIFPSHDEDYGKCFNGQKEPSDGVMNYIVDKDYIMAIRLYRAESGISLKDAKDVIEAIIGHPYNQ